ncbi:MAG TPA: CBS domain-containing protein [Polyangiaceae bacterium]|nr:CBS domain-containing protein [Polyangiaceae bacterium]
MPRSAQDIMNRELLSVQPDSPVDEVRELLRTFKVGAAPVVDVSGRPLGMVSVRDVLDASGTAADRMTRPALCVSVSTAIQDIARLLASSDLHHVVVVDSAGAAVGMISTLDVLRALVDLPARHPPTFPHWDATTNASWTDDWPLEAGALAHAPEAAGVLALVSSHFGEADAVVWVEGCTSVRQRVEGLLSPLGARDVALEPILRRRDVRFRAAPAHDEGARRRIVEVLLDRIHHTPPPGAT